MDRAKLHQMSVDETVDVAPRDSDAAAVGEAPESGKGSKCQGAGGTLCSTKINRNPDYQHRKQR